MLNASLKVLYLGAVSNMKRMGIYLLTTSELDDESAVGVCQTGASMNQLVYLFSGNARLLCTIVGSSSFRWHKALLQNDELLHIAYINLEINCAPADLGLGICFQLFEKIRDLSELQRSQDATYRLSVRVRGGFR